MKTCSHVSGPMKNELAGHLSVSLPGRPTLSLPTGKNKPQGRFPILISDFYSFIRTTLFSLLALCLKRNAYITYCFYCLILPVNGGILSFSRPVDGDISPRKRGHFAVHRIPAATIQIALQPPRHSRAKPLSMRYAADQPGCCPSSPGIGYRMLSTDHREPPSSSHPQTGTCHIAHPCKRGHLIP